MKPKYSMNKVDYANYLTIRILESMGLLQASQQQINQLEAVILETIELCNIIHDESGNQDIYSKHYAWHSNQIH